LVDSSLLKKTNPSYVRGYAPGISFFRASIQPKLQPNEVYKDSSLLKKIT